MILHLQKDWLYYTLPLADQAPFLLFPLFLSLYLVWLVECKSTPVPFVMRMQISGSHSSHPPFLEEYSMSYTVFLGERERVVFDAIK